MPKAASNLISKKIQRPNKKQRLAQSNPRLAVLYETWTGMRKRCNDPKSSSYKWYGGKGVRVDSRWDTFDAFVADMLLTWEPGLTIERKDSNGHYCKENCIWASRMAQSNNKSDNRLITFTGDTMTMAQWARKLKLPFRVLCDRLNKLQWDTEKALSTPVLDNRTRHTLL